MDGTPPAGVIAIYGPQSGGRMGIWIDEGDVDGDGFADIVIGSDQINAGGAQHVGGAYIVFGASNLPSVIDLASPPSGVRTARITGQGPEEHWGAALQIGDLNNDGIGDIIIGGSIFRDSGSYVTPNDQNTGHNNFGVSLPGRPGCGAAYVIYGQQNWPASIDLRTPPASATHVIGAHAFDLLGSQVHSGDLNGDGRNDLVLGALQAMAPDNKGKTGAVYIVYGAPNLPGSTIDLADPDSSGLRVTTIYGEHHLDCAGDSVRTYDINKDGLSDLFIGSPERTFDIGSEEREDAGVTEIIYGQRDFLPAVIKLYDPPASPRIFRLAGAHGDLQGIAGGDEFSYRLTGGDVDGDGYIDYIANAMHGDGFNNSLTNAGNVYIFSGKKLSAKLGMLPPDQTPTPALTNANLLLSGQVVQQASAGQSGLVVRVNGTGFRADTEIEINGLPVISHAGADAQQRLVNLDENTTIRNSVGALTVRARNTIPTPSEFSNQVNAGSLVGPEITSIKVKKKASGLLILKIHGVNFSADATVTITADGSAVLVQSASFDPPDYASVKIGAASAPASGTLMRVRVGTSQGVQSNEFTVTAK
jgi:hypothetical protein